MRHNTRPALRIHELFLRWGLLLGLLSAASCSHLEAREVPGGPCAPRLKRDFTMKTLGGRQFWGDVAFFRGFRIQQNVLTGHYRLLDPDDYRHASGSLQKCREKLAALKQELNLAPMSGRAVVVVHGILRSSKSFDTMCRRLRKEGYTVVTFDYPSTRFDIPQSAEFLHRVVETLDGIEEIHFVVHSMGGLIVRQYRAQHVDLRVKRMVMLGVPNHGAQLADRFRKLGLFRAIFGPAGQQLATSADGLIAGLPIPDFEFAVIAGARGTLNGYNPLIPGDDDGTVSVASTRLPGAADFLTVKSLHSFLMGNNDVIEATVRFLREGQFRENGARHSIQKLKARSKTTD
jgi:pimeloyl-ACP methyl ester carboxylesterase